MNELERLAVAQALYHELGRAVRTGDPGNLRGKADAMLADGTVDRVRLQVNGKSVGTLSARWAHARRTLEVTDREAFADYALGEGIALTREWIAQGMRGSLADFHASALIVDGVVPDGCEVVEEPERLDGTVIRGCRMDDVLDAYGGCLPPMAIAGLLGGA